jgi:hypothetical protein
MIPPAKCLFPHNIPQNTASIFALYPNGVYTRETLIPRSFLGGQFQCAFFAPFYLCLPSNPQ